MTMNYLDRKLEVLPKDAFFTDEQDLNSKSIFHSPKKHPIPRLPLLDDMVAVVKKSGTLPDLSRTVFIGVQHMLETTVTLFDALISLGVQPQNMYFSGKCYSSAPEIEAAVRERGIHLTPSNKPFLPGQYEYACRADMIQMWRYCLEDIRKKTVDRLIILDDGGRCLEAMPGYVALSYPIAAIEQTRGGLYSETTKALPFPLVEVATSIVKKALEPPLIATAVVNSLKNILSKLEVHKNRTFGVVGNGVIGNAVCQYLISLGYRVCVFDEAETAFQGINSHHLFRMENIAEILTIADVLIGCTGKDITAKIDIPGVVKKDKIFISCTSEDKEFRSFLSTITYSIGLLDSLSNITAITQNGRKILAIQGGFPINFDRKPWNVPAHKIEVTQGLLLGGCLQAIHSVKKLIDDGHTMNRGSRQILNPIIQRYVASHWLPRQEKEAYPADYLSLFQDLNWIEKNSGGTYYPDPTLEAYFSAPVVENVVSSERGFYAKL